MYAGKQNKGDVLNVDQVGALSEQYINFQFPLSDDKCEDVQNDVHVNQWTADQWLWGFFPLFWGHFIFLFTKNLTKLKSLLNKIVMNFCPVQHQEIKLDTVKSMNPNSDTRYILIYAFVIYLVTVVFLAFLNIKENQCELQKLVHISVTFVLYLKMPWQLVFNFPVVFDGSSCLLFLPYEEVIGKSHLW